MEWSTYSQMVLRVVTQGSGMIDVVLLFVFLYTGMRAAEHIGGIINPIFRERKKKENGYV